MGLTTALGGFSEQMIVGVQHEADVKSELEKILKAQSECWNKADIDGFMESYWKSTDLTFSSGGNVTRGWQATIDRYKKSYDTPEKMGTLKFDGLEISLLGDSAALMLGTWELTFSKETDAEPVGGKFTLVFRKFDDGWKIIHDHTSSLKSSNEEEQ